MQRIYKILLFLLISVDCFSQTYTKDFFGSTHPSIFNANNNIKFVNLSDMKMYRQTSIPKGVNWVQIGTNSVLTTDFLPEGVINKYAHGSTGVDSIRFGFGLIGGLITQYGLVKVDSFSIATYYRLYKAIDSLAALIPVSGGTVTNFSSGNLSPLFTTNVATSTTTPALTFTLSNATSFTVFGRATGTGAPSFQAIDTSWIGNFYLKVRGLFSATSPLVYSNGDYSIPVATSSVNGYLSSTDWNTFNNKQAAGTYVTSVSGTSNRITSTGGTTPVLDISSSYVGQNSITTLGTITTGVWNGTAIANANLANSAVTVNGTSISLGSSGTVTAVPSNIQYAIKSSDLATTSTTMVDVTDMSFSVAASGNYIFEFSGRMGSSVTNGGRFTITCPAGATIEFQSWGNLGSSGTSVTPFGVSASASETPTYASGAAAGYTQYAYIIKGTVKVAGTSGTVQLRARSINAANTFTIYAGGQMQASKIN